eukprot:XP_014785580.1 PREDICTED: zinc finger MYM-type protein 1-like [Octopus bimaculoides]
MVVQQEAVIITTDPASWLETTSDGMHTDIMKLGANPDFYSKMLSNGKTKVQFSMMQYIVSVASSERNMAFRGVSDKLYIHGNGNFLGEVQLLVKFNLILAEHLPCIQNAETVAHYLGPDNQNELISLISDCILKVITNQEKAAKYYSIVLDCTPDISHQEQITMIIHFVELQKGKTKIKEYFVRFLKVTDTNRAELFESFLEKLDLMDCRGQTYDNGSNMKGKHSGVQARFLQKNPRAFYLHCMNHSLNLVCNAASSSVTAVSFFGYFQCVFSFFATSTSR